MNTVFVFAFYFNQSVSQPVSQSVGVCCTCLKSDTLRIEWAQVRPRRFTNITLLQTHPVAGTFPSLSLSLSLPFYLSFWSGLSTLISLFISLSLLFFLLSLLSLLPFLFFKELTPSSSPFLRSSRLFIFLIVTLLFSANQQPKGSHHSSLSPQPQCKRLRSPQGTSSSTTSTSTSPTRPSFGGSRQRRKTSPLVSSSANPHPSPLSSSQTPSLLPSPPSPLLPSTDQSPFTLLVTPRDPVVAAAMETTAVTTLSNTLRIRHSRPRPQSRVISATMPRAGLRSILSVTTRIIIMVRDLRRVWVQTSRTLVNHLCLRTLSLRPEEKRRLQSSRIPT